MFLTTPWVSDQVTPSILNSAARLLARSKSQPMWSGSSVSIFLSLKTRGHSRTDAHEMQCSGKRGVFWIVQSGYVVWGVFRSSWHSMHAVRVGRMTLLWPLKPVSAIANTDTHISLMSVSMCLGRRLETVRTLRPAVDERLHALWVVLVDELHELCIDPPPRLDAVEPADDEVELHVVLVVLVLDLAKVRGDLASGDASHDELCCRDGFWASDILVAVGAYRMSVSGLDGACMMGMKRTGTGTAC